MNFLRTILDAPLKRLALLIQIWTDMQNEVVEPQFEELYMFWLAQL